MRTYIGLSFCLCLLGCNRPARCRAEADCAAKGPGARCEATGLCSLPDDHCDSGHRYVQGPDPLARTCVRAPATCFDKQLDGDETDVDCGGLCRGCYIGDRCQVNHDCVIGMCEQSCQPATAPPFWIDEAPLPSARQDLAAAANLDRIFVVGGRDASGPVATVDVYDPVTRSWAPGPSLSAPRTGLGLALGQDSRLYAVGGSDGTEPVGTVERLDVDSWVKVAPLPTPRALLAVGHALDAIYAIGGVDSTGQPSRAIERFDLVTWTTGPTLPMPLAALAVSPPGGNGGPLFLLGGRTASGPTALVESYDPTLGTIGALDPLPSAREGLAGSPDGLERVYAIGGTANGVDSGEVDRYGNAPVFTDSAEHWETLAHLLHPRHGLSACLGPDGRVYAIGGADASGAVAFVESYGPRVTLTPNPAHPGQAVTVEGDNFAPNSRVYFQFLTSTSSEETTTDDAGRLPPFTYVAENEVGVEQVQVNASASVLSFDVYLTTAH